MERFAMTGEERFQTENGIMTLDDWLDVYERHIPAHIEQMQANYQA
jgi:hypothetical protein